LESVSTWADEVKLPSTAAWHYINFPRDGDCRIDAGVPCPGGACVVSAIERQAAVLASGAPDDAKLKALKYIVHFVADVHQPLHAGYADDKGGSGYQVQAFGRGSNMHSVWDRGLIASWPGGEQALLAAAEGELEALPFQGDAVGPGVVPADKTAASRWAEESCRIVGTVGFYPDGHKLEAAYVQRWAPTLVHQLAAASKRLADLLNRCLSTKGHP
jgi:hypothetical protein